MRMPCFIVALAAAWVVVAWVAWVVARVEIRALGVSFDLYYAGEPRSRPHAICAASLKNVCFDVCHAKVTG